MNPLQVTPLRKSLNRQATLLGAERIPVAMLILMSALLVFSGMTLITAAMGITLFFVGIAALRAMYKEHPQMTTVYRLSTKYRKYYPAQVTLPAPYPHRDVVNKLKNQANR